MADARDSEMEYGLQGRRSWFVLLRNQVLVYFMLADYNKVEKRRVLDRLEDDDETRANYEDDLNKTRAWE